MGNELLYKYQLLLDPVTLCSVEISNQSLILRRGEGRKGAEQRKMYITIKTIKMFYINIIANLQQNNYCLVHINLRDV